MTNTKGISFKHNSFENRLRSMMAVDFKRLFTSRMFYVIVAIALVMPILILVMTTSMAGTTTVTTDPMTGVETVTETQSFTNAWQVVESIRGESSGMSMDMTSMCNINLMYFLMIVLLCTFICDDFRYGYVKNLFTVRPQKGDYVVSKTLVGFISGIFLIAAYVIGAVIGGKIAGLPFDTGVAGVSGVVMCLISKIFMMAVLVGIYVLISSFGKQKLWVSILGSFAAGMLLFTMIPMMTPLNSGIMNVLLCVVGGVLFAGGFGVVSKKVLER